MKQDDTAGFVGDLPGGRLLPFVLASSQAAWTW